MRAEVDFGELSSHRAPPHQKRRPGGRGRRGPRGRRRSPRRPRPARFFAERCILLSRMTVGTALSSAKCTFRRLSTSGRLSRGRLGAPSPSHRGAVGARPAGRAHSAAGSPTPGPSSFRERVGFQSNAHLPPARSTRNLRAREGSGTGRRDPGMGEAPGTGSGGRDRSGCRAPSRTSAPAGPAVSSKWSLRSSGRPQRPPPDPRMPSPTGPRTPFVQICHKDPDQAGAHEKKR